MEQNKNIVILTGGTMLSNDGEYHSTSYDDGDAFGTLGGYARVEAAAILAKKNLNTKIVTTGIGHSTIMKNELIELGIDSNRIILEEISTSSKTGLEQAIILSEKNCWKNISFISNEYHIPRLKIMWKILESRIEANFISAEEVIMKSRPEFKKEFEKIKKSKEYIKRLESEKRGIEALKSGKYKNADIEDKKERVV